MLFDVPAGCHHDYIVAKVSAGAMQSEGGWRAPLAGKGIGQWQSFSPQNVLVSAVMEDLRHVLASKEAGPC